MQDANFLMLAKVNLFPWLFFYWLFREAPKKVEPTTTSSWQSKLQNGGSSFEQKAASNGTSSGFGGSKFGGASNGESTSFGGSKFGGAGNNGDAKCNQIKVMFWSAEGSEVLNFF